MSARDLACLALAATLVGCGDDAASPPPTGPDGEMMLTFAEPAADGACLSIGSDDRWHPTVVMDVEQIVLRPPGGCGSFVQCGHLALYAGAVLPADDIAAGRALCRGALEACEALDCDADLSACESSAEGNADLLRVCAERHEACAARDCPSEHALCDAGAEGLVLNNETAVPALTLRTDRLADPVHDGTPLANGAGDDLLRLRVIAIGPSGQVLYEDGAEQQQCDTSSACDDDRVCSQGLCRAAVTADLAVISVPDCAAL